MVWGEVVQGWHGGLTCHRDVSGAGQESYWQHRLHKDPHQVDCVVRQIVAQERLHFGVVRRDGDRSHWMGQFHSKRSEFDPQIAPPEVGG